MEKKLSFSEVLKKYTMVIVLILVVIMFTVNTKGVMLLPQNVNNLVAQNAYVFILATGMLFCILTGGNIDLSVGSVVCFVAAVGGTAIKMVLICAVVLAFIRVFRILWYGLLLLSRFIHMWLPKQRQVVISMQLAVMRRLRSFPVSIQIKFISWLI